MAEDNVRHLPVKVVKTITVGLIQESVDALAAIKDLTDGYVVDIVNHALQTHAAIEEELHAGNRIYVVDTKGAMHRIKFGGR